MPADLTAVANLALDLLGEPYLADYAADPGTSAEAVRLHLPQCVATVLEGHAWSFATRCSTLELSNTELTAASVTLGSLTGNTAIRFTSVPMGVLGNFTTVQIHSPDFTTGECVAAAVSAGTVVLTPSGRGRMVISGITSPASANRILFYAGVFGGLECWTSDGTQPVTIGIGFAKMWKEGGAWKYISCSNATSVPDYDVSKITVSTTPDGLSGWVPTTGLGSLLATAARNNAEQGISAINANPSVASWVTAANAPGSDGSGALLPAASALRGGSDYRNCYAPAWGVAYFLPEDCLRLLKIDGTDIDVPVLRFEIQGRNLLLEDPERDAPVIHYIMQEPPPAEWPSTFTDAVGLLLASRLAPKLTGDQKLAEAFASRHEQALGKARSKDARETRSNENHSPRQMAARSGLVRARYGSTRPPF